MVLNAVELSGLPLLTLVVLSPLTDYMRCPSRSHVTTHFPSPEAPRWETAVHVAGRTHGRIHFPAGAGVGQTVEHVSALCIDVPFKQPLQSRNLIGLNFSLSDPRDVICHLVHGQDFHM